MRRLSLATGAVVAVLGIVVVRRAGIDWTRVSLWERAVGRAGTGRSFDHSPFGRALDILLLVVVPLGAVLLAPVVRGLFYRGDRRLALACIVLFGGSLATSELLKATLARRVGMPDRLAYGYPSGHTTVAFATAIVLVLAAPWHGRRLTPLAVAAGYVAFVGAGIVMDGWHLPSDAAGALCVTIAWTLASLAVLDPPVRVTVGRRDLVGAIGLTGLAIALLVTHLGVPTRAPIGRPVVEAIVAVAVAGAGATIGLACAIGCSAYGWRRRRRDMPATV
jgi:membrane-associated phospholipid phosphatase